MSDNQNKPEKLKEDQYQSGQNISEDTQPIKTSEFTQSLYNPIMNTATSLTIEEIIRKLNNSNIQFNPTQFYDTFTKVCIKTDWESTVYEVCFGKFKTILKVIHVRLQPNLLFNKVVNKGSYGQIFRFQLSNKEVYALKNITFNNNSVTELDFVLRQVMMAKIMSALEVGPKFYPIFFYDAIIYENKIQFAMELCRTNYTQIQIVEEVNNKNLLNLLKTIHSIGICHLDIKKENLGWSDVYRKLVFLDFSFTLSVKSKIGEKTLTGFVGTYHYSSPEMKKLFWLGTNVEVDLYYNDLNCLERVWEALNESKETLLLSLDKKASQVELQEVNKSLINYFEIKMSTFNENYAYAIRLINNEGILVKTVIRMLFSLREINDFPYNIEQRSKNSDIQIKNGNQIDLILLNYEVERANSSYLSKDCLEAFFDMSQSDFLFLKSWQDDAWKQKIFFYVDVYSNLGQDKFQPRKNLVRKIYKQIKRKQKKSSKISYFMMFRQVILYYFDFFKERKNILILQKIMSYFVLIGDLCNQERTEKFILNYWWAQEDKQAEYLTQNIKYFLGNISITQGYGDYVNNNIKNTKLLISRLTQKYGPQHELIKAATQALKLMKIFSKLKFKMDIKGTDKELLNKCKQQFQQCLCRSKYLKLEHKIYFDVLKNGFNTCDNSQQTRFQNFYLKRCWYYGNIQTFLKLEGDIQKLIRFKETQPFLKQITLPQTDTIFRFEQSRQLHNLQVVRELLQITKNVPIYKNDLIIVRYLNMLNKTQKQEYAIKILKSFDISHIKNLDQIMQFKGFIIFLQTYFLQVKLRSAQPLGQKFLNEFLSLIDAFCIFTQNIELFKSNTSLANQSEEEQSQNEIDLYIKHLQQKQLKTRHKLAVFLFFQLAGQTNKIMPQLTWFLVHNTPQNFNESLVNCVLCFSGKQANDQSKQILRCVILKQNQQILKNGYFDVYKQFPQFLLLVLKTYQSKKMWDGLKCCIQFASNYVMPNFVANKEIYQIIMRFIEQSQLPDLEDFLAEFLKISLIDFFSVHILSYILLLAQNCIQKLNGKLQPQAKKRLLILGVFYAEHVQEQFFTPYKLYLYAQAHATKCKKCKKITHKRKLAQAQTDLISSAQDFGFLNKYKQRNWQSQRKRTIYSKIINRTKFYFYNAQQQNCCY